MDVPEIFIFSDSKIKIDYETKVKVNKTETAIVIEGNKNGFLSLANFLIYSSNDGDHPHYNLARESQILVHKFPFVESDLELIVSYWEDNLMPEISRIQKIGAKKFIWEMSEITIDIYASGMHGLAYAFAENHLDRDMKADDISVYCVRNDDL